MTTTIRNARLYRELSQPFESVEKVNEAVEAFMGELRALREKHKIQDVHIVIAGTCLGADVDEEGKREEFPWMLTAHHGDQLKAESMAAYAFGRAAADRQEFVGKQTSRAIRPAKEPKG
jgi:hypothetical protein